MKVRKFSLLLAIVLVLLVMQGLGFVPFSMGGGEFESRHEYSGKNVDVVLLCRDITNHEPVNPDSVFFKNDNVYLYVKSYRIEPSQQITVNWYYGNVVKSSNMRIATDAPYHVWRMPTLHKRAGLWSVHVLVGDSLYLGGVNFVVKPNPVDL